MTLESITFWVLFLLAGNLIVLTLGVLLGTYLLARMLDANANYYRLVRNRLLDD